MTLEEKLQHFLESSMEDSRARSLKIVSDYQDALNKILTEHQEDAKRKAALEIKYQKEHIRHEGNKNLARENLLLKRKLTQKNNELTDKLFVEVNNLLEQFMRTPAYDRLLIKEINNALSFARGEKITIYIDPADSGKIHQLEAATGGALTVSDYSFGGGMRAVILSNNILIDLSFESKLAEARDKFRFDGGEFHAV